MATKRIAVYGSLRQGMGNYQWHLKDMTPTSVEVVSVPFRMVDLGGFPGLIQTDEVNPIVVETYDVNDAQYSSIERLEGYPRFYNRQQIETSSGRADIYYLQDGRGSWYNGSPEVSEFDGAQDWVKHVENRNKRKLKANEERD